MPPRNPPRAEMFREEPFIMSDEWQAKIIEALASRVAGEVDRLKIDLADLKQSNIAQEIQLAQIRDGMARHRAWHLAIEGAAFSMLISAAVYLFGSKLAWW